MAYNGLLSFAMIPFDLVLLFHLRFRHRSTAAYYVRMKHALAFLILSCVLDVAAGILSRGVPAETAPAQAARIAVWGPVLVHAVAAVWVAVCLASFVRYMREAPAQDREAQHYSPGQKALLFLALPLLAAVVLYELFVPGAVMAVSCYLSLLVYAFFFLTEFPIHDRLKKRLAELEDALARARSAEAQAAGEDLAKNDFLTNMSHEIRTPMNAILGMDEMILRSADGETIRGYARDIRDAGNTLLGIINNILDFSGIEPGAVAEPAIAEEQEQSAESRRFFAPDVRVLAVDDTESNLRVAEQLLKQTMIRVDTCLSGESCLALLREKTYDAVLLDHMMPGMDGIETLKAARALPGFDPEKTKVIVLTANAIAGAREMYLAEGFDDYLSKPVESDRLEETLMKHLPADKLITASDPRYAECREKLREEMAAREQMLGESGKADMEVLRQVRGVNLDEALRLCADPSILRATMCDFAESIDDEADLIRQYVEEEDWKNYTIKVHSLKSVARLIGADALSDDARFLEGCGNAENIAEIREKTPKLLEDYRAYHEYLAPVLRKDDADGTRELIPDDELEEAYEALREFVEMHDFDSADYIMETLSGYRIPADKRERYEKIRKAVRRVDRTKLLEELL